MTPFKKEGGSGRMIPTKPGLAVFRTRVVDQEVASALLALRIDRTAKILFVVCICTSRNRFFVRHPSSYTF
jgi:hypothetical protein